MPKRYLVFAFVMSTSLAFGQLDSNSITVSAYRSTTLQPDQVVFSVDVSSGLDTSLDDVIAALGSTGISIANFNRVSPYSQWIQTDPTTPTLQLGLDWYFTLPVAWSKMKDTMAMLAALQKSIPQKNSSLMLSFGVQGTQVSDQLQQTQTCSVPDLLSDARAQAQKLANSANLFVGAVLAMSSSAYTGPPLYNGFSPGCGMTVKFAVTR
jgi:hypothetical protein